MSFLLPFSSNSMRIASSPLLEDKGGLLVVDAHVVGEPVRRLLRPAGDQLPHDELPRTAPAAAGWTSSSGEVTEVDRFVRPAAPATALNRAHPLVHRPIRDRQAQLLQPVLQLLLGRDGLGLACRLGLQRLCFSLCCFDLVEVALQSRQLRASRNSGQCLLSLQQRWPYLFVGSARRPSCGGAPAASQCPRWGLAACFVCSFTFTAACCSWSWSFRLSVNLVLDALHFRHAC
jgi:hypothetical protein